MRVSVQVAKMPAKWLYQFYQYIPQSSETGNAVYLFSPEKSEHSFSGS
jgi:hypothetical protein